MIAKPPLWQRVRPYLAVFDPPLMLTLALIAGLSLVTMYSAAFDYPGRFESHARNLALAFVVMWAAANVPTTTLMRLAVPAFVVGLLLLLGVAFFGEVSKGARRWLDLGL